MTYSFNEDGYTEDDPILCEAQDCENDAEYCVINLGSPWLYCVEHFNAYLMIVPEDCRGTVSDLRPDLKVAE